MTVAAESVGVAADKHGLPEGLAVRDVRVVYGGHVAVSKVDLDAPLGRVTGLIGPNGAGKTTTFNACSGLLKPTNGTFSLLGSDVSRIGASGRARRGLGRTFQRVEVCEAMDVLTNVALGLEARTIGRNPLRQFGGARAQQRQIIETAEQALHRCGIADIADRPVGMLSIGQKRLVELARVLTGGFQVMLLDEPSSGLDEEETKRFGEVLRSVMNERTGILLVEHDMSLVMQLCEYIYVLDFGNLIFTGSPGEVRDSETVRTAYLGESAEATS
ncbi:hypothetical protein GCM10009547_01290 [Sporichthya brevicatena]|uniref:ABC transporter domain-containing protein n=1 Tax=Sporichthya brevicatena TaxID=171442 RepID=A0ABP3RA37_9ACTN